MTRSHAKIEADFWANTGTDSKHPGCLIYRPKAKHDGYRTVYFKGLDLGAHVVSFILANKRRPRSGMIVCHSCDWPPCVEPTHLFEGTYQQNMDDMKSKKRQNKIAGDKHWTRRQSEKVLRGARALRAKLQMLDVRVIRYIHRKQLVSQTELAKRYSVSDDAISHVVNYKTYKSPQIG